jgi:hypothetical protein
VGRRRACRSGCGAESVGVCADSAQELSAIKRRVRAQPSERGSAAAGARSGQTGGVEAAGSPAAPAAAGSAGGSQCSGAGAGVTPPDPPASGEVACRDAVGVQNCGRRWAGGKCGMCVSTG